MIRDMAALTQGLLEINPNEVEAEVAEGSALAIAGLRKTLHGVVKLMSEGSDLEVSAFGDI